MATFLQLVNRVERESGTISQSQRLSSVTGAVGRQEKIVYWTAQAWETIQRSRPDWTFRTKEFTASLVAGQKRYTAAELSITDLGSWLRESNGWSPYSLYDPDTGLADETRLPVKDYRTWKDCYDFGSHDANRPLVMAFDPDRKPCVGPAPDQVYTLRGAYQRQIQTLAADVDEPYISADHHDTIVWQALVLLSEHDEAIAAATMAAQRYRMAHAAMVREYTDCIVE